MLVILAHTLLPMLRLMPWCIFSSCFIYFCIYASLVCRIMANSQMMASSATLPETISVCLSEAQSDSLEQQQKALQTLAAITKVSPQNRNLLAKTNVAVATLLALSKSSSSTIQSLSLSILFSLSLNPDLKKSLAEMETIYVLNSIILTPISQESSRLAASLVCSLAMLDKNKAKFGVAGTVEVLVNVIAKPRGAAAHHLLSSLAELVQFHGNCTLAVRSGAVQVLIQLVESTDGEDLAGTSLSVLGLLARFVEGLNALMQTEHIVNTMLNMLKGRCTFSKEGAADILLRLFDESEGYLREAMSLPEFVTVLADLSVRGSSRAREKTSYLMKKMMEADFSALVAE